MIFAPDDFLPSYVKPAPSVDENHPHARAKTQLLLALNRTGKHIYGGKVTAAEKVRRRAAGKAQKAARKVGR